MPRAVLRWDGFLAAFALVALLLLPLPWGEAQERVWWSTREDKALQRFVTECTDGSRAITR